MSQRDPSAGADTAESGRLVAAREGVPWRRWGPYLSERQWGTVREDCSGDGNAWQYFTHDEVRSRAYRWGEDGLAGLCDDRQRLCFALALWSGADPILEERLFGLTNAEGNHGEDVTEYYYFLDATPTSSYLHWRNKYSQRAYPYEDLITTNRARSRHELECPTGSGQPMTLAEVARELCRRLASNFVADEHGHRPAHGGVATFQDNPTWKGLPLFYEYFHGDIGAGLGASRQTGWTGLVARVIQVLCYTGARELVDHGAIGVSAFRMER